MNKIDCKYGRSEAIQINLTKCSTNVEILVILIICNITLLFFLNSSTQTLRVQLFPLIANTEDYFMSILYLQPFLKCCFVITCKHCWAIFWSWNGYRIILKIFTSIFEVTIKVNFSMRKIVTAWIHLAFVLATEHVRNISNHTVGVTTIAVWIVPQTIFCKFLFKNKSSPVNYWHNHIILAKNTTGE